VREIVRLEHERAALLVERDLETLNQLVPDNFTLTRASGVRLTKTEVLAALRSGDLITNRSAANVTM
jgi:hypothetical protein